MTVEQKIPKIIHYCWFGCNPKPQLVLYCIESWKKHCPDYQIIEWNESNFDIHSSAFVEEAYQAKKWAFVSDCVRASVLFREGGIYIDTDFELLQSLDPLLSDSSFVGFEVKDTIGSAIIGCEKGSGLIQCFYEFYKDKHYSGNENNPLMTSPVIITEILKKWGLKLNGKKQIVSGCVVYSKSVFFPTGVKWLSGKYSSKTVGVHHYMDSWGRNTGMSDRSRLSKLRLSILYSARSVLGTRRMYNLGQRIRNRKHS